MAIEIPSSLLARSDPASSLRHEIESPPDLLPSMVLELCCTNQEDLLADRMLNQLLAGPQPGGHERLWACKARHRYRPVTVLTGMRE